MSFRYEMARDYRRLDRFLDQIGADVYPEAESSLHSGISRDMFLHLVERFALPERARVLDVGCGSGVGLELFRDYGLDAVGITLAPADIETARARGFAIEAMDQSFLDFPDRTFDLVWARHVVEHSIFPYFTLSEMNRVLKPGALLYLEVPGAETAAHHEQNPNHYSVLGRSMWEQLVTRSGFSLEEALTIDFEINTGPDAYWVFFCRKEVDAPRRRQASAAASGG
jgi:SAM-dependent methyltransferase